MIRSIFGLMLLAAGLPAAARTCDVTAFGARPNDERADTAAIQKAIHACAGTGGTVVVPAGTFLTGGLTLGSDMVFRLGPGAVLKAIPDIALYPMRADARVARGAAPEEDAYDRYQAILYAGGVRNLVIEGPGTLDGQGPLFWDPNFHELGIPRPTRPRPQQMIELIDCADVTVRGIRMVEAPAYSLRFYRCDRVRAEGITIRNDPRSPNTDGIQIRDTVNAFITGADIATGDDAIVVKSYDRMVDNLVVTDSILMSDDSALKFGTAGHKGVTNSLFSNIIIRESRFGIALFQMDGGRYANNRFHNIAIETGGRGERHLAIYADIDQRRPDRPLGAIEGLTFSDIRIATRGNILIAGQRQAPIRDLVMERIIIEATAPSERFGPRRTKPRGNAFVAPTGQTEDFAGTAASITIANAADVRLSGVDIRHADPTVPRAGIALVNVAGVDIAGLSLSNPAASAPAIRLSATRDVAIRDTGRLRGVATLLAVDGGHGGRLSVRNADLSGLASPFRLPDGVRLDQAGNLGGP
jgi:polygalacturonase